jgi:flagellar P-ring protein FlgI
MRYLLLAITATVLWGTGPVEAGVRIEDITDLEGARKTQLIGFGLVVGLDGTGGKSTFTQQVAVDMLSRFNVNAKIAADTKGDAVFKSGNISAVMVTADLGPTSRRGSTIDVTVSVLDDATSLQGGYLLMTPLKGSDQVDYAVAQGPLLVGGFSFSASGGGKGGQAASTQKNHPTVGRITNGATVEHELRGEIVCNGQLRFMLRQADFETSRNIANAINVHFPNTAVTVDSGAVQVFVPREMKTKLVDFVSELQKLEVNVEAPAKVIINERTGTIAAGHQVQVSQVALAHGNLAIVTSDESIASQPAPFSKGKTVILPRAQVNVTEQAGQVHVLPRAVTVAELARALNALGATPRDLIVIFQMLKQVGALHAELIVM